MQNIILVLSLSGCLPTIVPIERQKIVDVGGCNHNGYCVVRTSTGLVSYMQYPIVGIEVCEFAKENELLLQCKDTK